MSATYPIEIAGARFASDGLCLVGEGHPLPERWLDPGTGKPRPWLTPKGWAKSGHESQRRAEAMLAHPWRPGLTTPALDRRVHRRFGPLLRAARRVDLYTEQDPQGGERAVLVRAFWGEGVLPFFCCVVLHPSYTALGLLTERDRAEYPTVRELLMAVAAGGVS